MRFKRSKDVKTDTMNMVENKDNDKYLKFSRIMTSFFVHIHLPEGHKKGDKVNPYFTALLEMLLKYLQDLIGEKTPYESLNQLEPLAEYYQNYLYHLESLTEPCLESYLTWLLTLQDDIMIHEQHELIIFLENVYEINLSEDFINTIKNMINFINELRI